MGFYKIWLLIGILSFSAFTKSSGSVMVSIYVQEPDTLKVRQLIDSGKHYLFKPYEYIEDLDKSKMFLEQAITLSDSLGLNQYKFETIKYLGINYLERRNINEARKWYDKVNDYYQQSGNKDKQGQLWLDYGRKIFSEREYSTEALSSYQRAVNLFKESNNRIKEIEVLKQIADVHLNIGQLELAESELFEVLEKYKEVDFKKLHYTYDLLSVLYRLKGDLKSALSYGLKSVESMEMTKDTKSAATFYSRIAHTYRDLGNVEKSIEWYLKEIDIFLNRNLNSQIYFRDTKYLVSLLIAQNRENEALDIVKKIDKMYPNSVFSFEINQNYALVYQALGDYDLSEKFLLKMLNDLNSRYYPDWIIGEALIQVGKFYLEQNKYSKAKYYFAEAKVDQVRLNMADMRDLQLSLFKVDSASGDYLNAIRHLQRYNKLNDSLINETKVKEIEKLQIEYETAQKEQNIALLTNQSELQKIELAQSRTTKNLVLIGLFFLMIFLIVLYIQFKIIQKRNKAINKKNEDLESLIEEKEWLNKEIHHRVKNNLQVIISLLNTQSKYLKEGTAFNSVTDSRNRMQAMSLIHQKLYLPQGKDYIDIVSYINELVNHLQDSYHSNHKINLQTEIDSPYVGVTQATPLGLILNEAISNSIKYAYPTNKNGTISISLKTINDNDCILEVSDDGVGLPMNFNIDNTESLGLSLIKGLSKQLGGTFELISDVGVRISVVFPKQRFIEQESGKKSKKIGLEYEY